MCLFTTISVAIIFCYRPALSQDTCGYIGNTNETEVTPSRARMLYLDTENPATCSGEVTSFRVCYYAPENLANLTSFRYYWALYAVYRKMNISDRSNIDIEGYVKVSEQVSAIRLLHELSVDVVANFTCYNDTLNKDSNVTIQEGDILGACVFQPADSTLRWQLDVAGEVSGHSLMQIDAIGCSEISIPSMIPEVNELTMIASRKLHIHASIGKSY